MDSCSAHPSVSQKKARRPFWRFLFISRSAEPTEEGIFPTTHQDPRPLIPLLARGSPMESSSWISCGAHEEAYLSVYIKNDLLFPFAAVRGLRLCQPTLAVRPILVDTCYLGDQLQGNLLAAIPVTNHLISISVYMQCGTLHEEWTSSGTK